MGLRTELSRRLQQLALHYLGPGGRTVHLSRYGVTLRLQPNIMGYYMLLEKFHLKRYEMGALDLLARHAREGDIVDVGANEGFYSLCLGKLAKAVDNRILAFEPLPANLELLRGSVKINGLTETIEVVPTALGNRQGEVTLFVPQSGYGSYATTVSEVASDTAESVSVPIDTLDRSLETRGTRPISLIKIDVEGAEYDVLLGASKLIKAHRPAIFLELEMHRQPGGQVGVDKIVEFLSKHGYTLHSHTRGAQIRPFDGRCRSGHNLYAVADL